MTNRKRITGLVCAVFLCMLLVGAITQVEREDNRLSGETISALRSDYPDYTEEFYTIYDYVIDPVTITYEQLFESDGDHLAIIVCTVSDEVICQEEEIYAVDEIVEDEETKVRFQEGIKEYQIPVKVDEVIMSSEPILSDEMILRCTEYNFLATEQFQVGERFVLCLGKYSEGKQYGPSLPISYYLYGDQYLIPFISDTKGRNIEGMSLDSYRDMIHKIIEGAN